jgi:type IV secretion system protein VirD4
MNSQLSENWIFSKNRIAFLPGYGIKAYLIAQDINQLYAHYGRDEAITSTCHVQCAFAPNWIETAEHLSKLTGQTTRMNAQFRKVVDALLP